MNPTRLFIFGVLLCVLTWGLFQWKPERPSPPLQRPTESFLPLNPMDIVEMSFFQPQGETVVRLVLENGSWNLLEPIRDRADPGWIQALLQGLSSDPWTPAPPEWAAFEDQDLGLAKPSLLAEFLDKNGREALLRVGVAELGGSRHAVSVNGVRLRVGRGTLDFFRRSFHSWREMRVVEQPQFWDHILWEDGKGASRSFVRTEGRWSIQAPFAGPLSRKGRNALQRLLRLRTDELPEDVVTEKVRKTIEGGERWTFRNGSEMFSLSRFEGTVLAGNRPYPLYVHSKEFILGQLSQEDLLGDYLFEEPPAEMVSIRLSWAGHRQDFRRRGQGWVHASPGANGGVASHLLSQLADQICHFEIKDPLRVPGREPDGFIILSRSRTPLAKSGLQISIWQTEAGEVLVGDPASGGWLSSPPIAPVLKRILEQG